MRRCVRFFLDPDPRCLAGIFVLGVDPIHRRREVIWCTVRETTNERLVRIST
jgi:hypothetical protein